jgi:hypothetical protein
MLTLLVALVVTSPRDGATADRQPRMGPDAGTVCAQGGCRTAVFYRPKDCKLHRRTRTRHTYRCKREEQLEVTYRGKVVEGTRKLKTVEGRRSYPVELIHQWRRCPFRRDQKLGRFADVYQDPDVGRCYLLRMDRKPPPPPRRVRLLKKLHPYLAKCIEDMVGRAQARGEDVRVISGIRGPKRAKRGRYKGGGWHAFGLAVDIYVGRYGGLKKAVAAYLSGEDAAVWERLGSDGERCGLRWVGRRKAKEIFHFEWHPGWPGAIKGDLYQRLARAWVKRGPKAVWSQLRYRSSRKTAFKHLRDR